MRRLAAGVAVAVAALGMAMAGAGPAAAQISCVGERTASPATVTPTSVLPGESVSLTGGGFEGNQALGIGLFRPPVVLATVASDVHGNYTASVQLPLVTPPGQNEITVFGPGPDGTCHESLALFTVKPLPAPAPTVAPPPHHPPHPPVVVHHPPVTILHSPATTAPPTTAPAPTERQQPLARTGSESPALAAGALVAMLLGLHLVRVARPRRPSAG